MTLVFLGSCTSVAVEDEELDVAESSAIAGMATYNNNRMKILLGAFMMIARDMFNFSVT